MKKETKKPKEYVTCPECGKRIYLTDENTEKVTGVTIVYCESGCEFELK